MSRQNPHTSVTVIGTLTGAHTYNPAINLGILELWGTGMSPDDLVVEREELSPMSGIGVEDGPYTMEYEWNGQRIKKQVRVVGGRLLGTTG